MCPLAGTFRLGVSVPRDRGTFWDVINRIHAYCNWTVAQSTTIGLGLAVTGIVAAVGMLLSSTRSLSARNITRGIFCSWLTFTLLWHAIWSNLDIFQDQMAYEVHARFWQQPHIFVCIAAGFGAMISAAILEQAAFYTLSHRDVLQCRSFLFAFVCAMVGMRTKAHHAQLNFSHGGWALHTHGASILAAIPDGGLLVSHSDLHWNTARYLRLCEQTRRDVVHLSIQLVPYPWFGRQSLNYRGVNFPKLAQRSTRLQSPQYQQMLETFLEANVQNFSDSGIYIDLHGIYEPSIGQLGAWGSKFALIPWGLAFRVVRIEDLKDASIWLDQALRQLDNLRNMYARSPPGRPPGNQFRDGSWERAALTAYNDAHYQSGLWVLTFAQVLRENIKKENFAIYLRALREAFSLTNSDSPVTSTGHDKAKNSLLASVLLHGALSTALQMPQPSAIFGMPGLGVGPATHRELDNVARQANQLAAAFVSTYPDDKDAALFSKFLENNTARIQTNARRKRRKKTSAKKNVA